MDIAEDASRQVLFERDEALATLDTLAAQVNAGSGRVGYIEAGAGLGKTALLDAFAARLATRDTRILRARCSELERDFPFGVVRQLLAPIWRSRELAEVILSGAAATARVLFDDVEQDVVRHMVGLEPFEVMHAVFWALANLCDLGPVALLVDDAHDADAVSLELMAFLANRLADLPMLVLLASRPGYDVRADEAVPALLHVREAAWTQVVPLPPFGGEAVSAVLAQDFGGSPDPAFVDACAESTGGNPFYLRELISAVQERGLAALATNAGWAAQLGPTTIVQRTLFRLASLSTAAAPLARAVAVLGDGATLRDCAELAELSMDDAAAAADALVTAGVIAAGPMLTFSHPILRSAVLADLGEHSRRRWHARAAQVLDDAGATPEVVASHLMRADTAGDPHRRQVLLSAGRNAARRGSLAAAAQLLRRARDEMPELPDADLSYELGFAEASLGLPEGLRSMATGALATADAGMRVDRALRLANFQMRSGDLIAAVRLLGEVRETVSGDSEIALALDTTRYWAGRLHPDTRDDALRQAEQLKRRADGPNTSARRTLLAYLGCEAAQSESAVIAEQYFERALAPPGLLAHVPFDSVAVQATMLSLLATERDEQFDRLANEVLEQAGRHGALLAFLVVSTFRCMALLRRGDLHGADTEAGEALHSAAEQGWQRGAAGLAALRAIALLEQGDLQAAELASSAVGQMSIAPGFPTALNLLAQGRLAAARGDRRAGVAAILDCGATLSQMRLESPGVIAWRSQAAAQLHAEGDVAQARQLAQEEVELARRLSGPLAVGRALHALALTAKADEQIEMLRAAYATLASSSASLARAEVTVELGAALRRTKNHAEARTLLTAGLEIASRCRCTPLEARARDELAALGVVPRRVFSFGPLALTPSEVRVARIAAQGRTNTEIAQQLFITRKTVEKHLASCFRKLGIDSRTQLDASELTDPDPPTQDPRQ